MAQGEAIQQPAGAMKGQEGSPTRGQDIHDRNDWSTSSSNIDYPRHGEKDEIEMARDRTGSISSAELSEQTPLWNISTEKNVLFWPPAAWTEMYNQDNA